MTTITHYQPDPAAAKQAASILTSLTCPQRRSYWPAGWHRRLSRDNMSMPSDYWLNTIPLSWRSFVLLHAPVTDLLDLAVGGQLSSMCGREPEVPDGWDFAG